MLYFHSMHEENRREEPEKRTVGRGRRQEGKGEGEGEERKQKETQNALRGHRQSGLEFQHERFQRQLLSR